MTETEGSMLAMAWRVRRRLTRFLGSIRWLLILCKISGGNCSMTTGAKIFSEGACLQRQRQLLTMDIDHISGSPLEKMMLMLNDKVDKLSCELGELGEFIKSQQPAIPWAEYSGTTIPLFSSETKPMFVSEWRRRGWDVWKVSCPDLPNIPPHYSIRQRGTYLPGEQLGPPPSGDGNWQRTPVVYEAIE